MVRHPGLLEAATLGRLSFGVQSLVRLSEAYFYNVLQSQRISSIINESFLLLRIIPTVETYLRAIDVEKVSNAF